MTGTRSLTAALFAVVALGVMPSVAWGSTDIAVVGGTKAALNIEASEYPAVISGENVGEVGWGREEAGGLHIKCGNAEFFGGAINKPASQLKLEASYSECDWNGMGGTTTVSMNSCEYKFSSPEYTTGYSVKSEIVCDEEDAIEITLATGFECTLTIPAQVLNNETELLNTQSEGSDAVDLETESSGYEYTLDGTSGFACFLSFGHKLGTYEDGVSASNALLPDLSVTGGLPRVEAVSYPTEISGERFEDGPWQAPLLVLDGINALDVNCESVEVDAGTLSTPAPSVALDPTFAGCTDGHGEEVTIAMNSCSYELSDLNYQSDDDYFAEAEIVCGNEEDEIEINGYGGCVVGMPPQSLGSTSLVSNWAFESGAESVVAAIEDSTADYHRITGFACFLSYGLVEKTYENGLSQMGFELAGS